MAANPLAHTRHHNVSSLPPITNRLLFARECCPGAVQLTARRMFQNTDSNHVNGALVVSFPNLVPFHR